MSMQGLGTAVVTGASSGIGKVYADRLAQRGYDLLLVARRADRLEALARELKERHGVNARALVADLGNATELERVAQTIAGDPSITMLVNNAGTNAVAPLADTKQENLQAILNLNVVALTRLTIAVLPGFKERDRGTIINISSAVAFQPYAYLSVYGSSKAYVSMLTRTLQDELAGTNVTAQLVTPAATVSEIWDVQGFPLSAVDPAIVMTTEDCVDASLRGLDMGERITVPSLGDVQLLANYEAAAKALFAGTQVTGKPAARYAAAASIEELTAR